jgi:hypothetical protein
MRYEVSLRYEVSMRYEVGHLRARLRELKYLASRLARRIREIERKPIDEQYHIWG